MRAGRPAILVVEDEDEIRVLFQTVLEAAGYRVDSARTEAAAHVYLRMRAYDLIVADWKLGSDGDGVTVADAAVERGAKAIIVTGNAPIMSAADRARHKVLSKPLHVAELVEAVKRQIDPV